jgi:glycine/D-amino acid oxidase-like deaminating enzyme
MEKHTHPSSEKFTAGTNVPFWVETVPPISFQKLALDKKVDVVIVGGGIAGVSVAYQLTKAGKKIALVEDGFIGSGETGRTTAHLVSALDDRYYKLESIFGNDGAKLIASSHSYAVDFIERTVEKENIQCDFERLDGYLFLHPTDDEKNLDKEFEAAQKAGLNVIKTSISMGRKSIS